MEGSVSKIRTMARDLDATRRPVGLPASGAGVASPKKPAPVQRGAPTVPKIPPPRNGNLAPPHSQKKAIDKPAQKILRRLSSRHATPTPAKKQKEEGFKKNTPEPRLSDILKTAQQRMREDTRRPATSNTKTPTTTPKVKNSSPLPATTQEPSQDALLPIEDVVPIEPSSSNAVNYREPPPNLPTESPSTLANKPSLSLPAAAPTKRGGPGRTGGAITHNNKRPSPIHKKGTPEEILGLFHRVPSRGKYAPGALKEHPSASSGNTTGALPGLRRIPTPTTSTSKKMRGLSGSQFALVAGLLGILLVITATGIYWNFFVKKPAPPPTATPTAPTITKQPKPQALIRYNGEHPITIDDLDYDTLRRALGSLRDTSLPSATITYIPIEHTSAGKTEYLGLKELFSILEINTPLDLSSYENSNLFLYTQNANAQNECESAGILDNSCYGPRLGIILDIRAQEGGAPKRSLAAQKSMLAWEQTIVNDVSPLIFAEYEIFENTAFKSGLYKNLNTRYINLPILVSSDQAVSVSTTSIDWILTDEYLIIATSKNAARAAVDGLAL